MGLLEWGMFIVDDDSDHIAESDIPLGILQEAETVADALELRLLVFVDSISQ